MKIGRHYLGKIVKIVWRDPAGPERMAVSRAPKGRIALAIWTEYGVVDDISEGVIRLRQSEARDGGGQPDRDDEGCFTWTVEDLIESIEVLEPVKDGTRPLET